MIYAIIPKLKRQLTRKIIRAPLGKVSRGNEGLVVEFDPT